MSRPRRAAGRFTESKRLAVRDRLLGYRPRRPRDQPTRVAPCVRTAKPSPCSGAKLLPTSAAPYPPPPPQCIPSPPDYDNCFAAAMNGCFSQKRKPDDQVGICRADHRIRNLHEAGRPGPPRLPTSGPASFTEQSTPAGFACKSHDGSGRVGVGSSSWRVRSPTAFTSPPSRRSL